MNGKFFSLEGRLGRWSYAIDEMRGADGAFVGAADIRLQDVPRCKLILIQPNTKQGVGLTLLQTKCEKWIEDFESNIEPRS